MYSPNGDAAVDATYRNRDDQPQSITVDAVDSPTIASGRSTVTLQLSAPYQPAAMCTCTSMPSYMDCDATATAAGTVEHGAWSVRPHCATGDELPPDTVDTPTGDGATLTITGSPATDRAHSSDKHMKNTLRVTWRCRERSGGRPPPTQASSPVKLA